MFLRGILELPDPGDPCDDPQDHCDPGDDPSDVPFDPCADPCDPSDCSDLSLDPL